MSNTLNGTVPSKGNIKGHLQVVYGKSAYDIAVANGFEGTEEEWLASISENAAEEVKKEFEENGEYVFYGGDASGKGEILEIPDILAEWENATAEVRQNKENIESLQGEVVTLQEDVTTLQNSVVDVEHGGTGASTASDARKMLETSQAIESSEYSGCYYRMVDGEQEWLNPPMIKGEEYRTTERFEVNVEVNGEVKPVVKPVYVKYFTYYIDETNTTLDATNIHTVLEIPHGIDNYGERVRVEAIKGATKVLPYHTIDPRGYVSVYAVTENSVAILWCNCKIDAGTFGIKLFYTKKDKAVTL